MRDDSWVGLPNKLFDYLAAGLRVASSLNGECGELLRRERLGAVYDFASPDSLLAALGSLRDSAAAVPLPEFLRADLPRVCSQGSATVARRIQWQME